MLNVAMCCLLVKRPVDRWQVDLQLAALKFNKWYNTGTLALGRWHMSSRLYKSKNISKWSIEPKTSWKIWPLLSNVCLPCKLSWLYIKKLLFVLHMIGTAYQRTTACVQIIGLHGKLLSSGAQKSVHWTVLFTGENISAMRWYHWNQMKSAPRYT